jgi:hypothetical protein
MAKYPVRGNGWIMVTSLPERSIAIDIHDPANNQSHITESTKTDHQEPKAKAPKKAPASKQTDSKKAPESQAPADEGESLSGCS